MEEKESIFLNLRDKSYKSCEDKRRQIYVTISRIALDSFYLSFALHMFCLYLCIYWQNTLLYRHSSWEFPAIFSIFTVDYLWKNQTLFILAIEHCYIRFLMNFLKLGIIILCILTTKGRAIRWEYYTFK